MLTGHILEIYCSVLYWPEGEFFMKKGQNKALHNFHKRGQRSIVEQNIGLEYALRK